MLNNRNMSLFQQTLNTYKESKQVLELDQFQTCKWNAWQHQVAINIRVACFLLKKKLLCFDDLPLLSANEIRNWICFKLTQKLTDDEMIELMFSDPSSRAIASRGST